MVHTYKDRIFREDPATKTQSLERLAGHMFERTEVL